MSSAVPTRLVAFGTTSASRKEHGLEISVLGPARRIRGQSTNPFHWSMFKALAGAEIVHCHQQHVLATSLAALFGRCTGSKVFVSDLGEGGWDLSAYVSTDTWFRGHLHLSQFSREVFGHARRTNAHVIYGGVDADRFSPGPARIPPRPFKVLFVGRLVPHKGIHDLIEALPQGMELAIVGKPYHQAYARSLETLAHGKPVRFFHECPDEALVSHYRAAHCLVLPSVHRLPDGTETAIPELLGQTLLEGMPCGLPVVATRVASLPEIVTHEITGLLTEPNQPPSLRHALERLRDEPELRETMGIHGRQEILRRFQWKAVVDRCLTLYGLRQTLSSIPRSSRAMTELLFLSGLRVGGMGGPPENRSMPLGQARAPSPAPLHFRGQLSGIRNRATFGGVGARLGRRLASRRTLKNLESSELSARCGWSPTQPRSPN